jgi:hypothetical protein
MRRKETAAWLRPARRPFAEVGKRVSAGNVSRHGIEAYQTPERRREYVWTAFVLDSRPRLFWLEPAAVFARALDREGTGAATFGLGLGPFWLWGRPGEIGMRLQ